MLSLSRDGRVVSHQGVGEQPSLVRDTVVMVLVTNKTEVWPHTVERGAPNPLVEAGPSCQGELEIYLG